METQSVRIDKEIIARIKKQVKHSRQPISAFINIALDYKLKQIEMDNEVLRDFIAPKKSKK